MKIPKLFNPSPNTILLQWPPGISEEIQQTIQHTKYVVKRHFSEEILEITPTYNEIAVYLKEEVSTAAFMKKLTEVIQQERVEVISNAASVVTIPVCYDYEFALDLAAVAQFHTISEEEVIIFHTQPLYRVSFIGFLPGFPYVTGLSEKLHTPRKETPRATVLKGSVGIGGQQTGVYPSNSPGGWHIIGRSPIAFFSAEREVPSLLSAGDTIKFQAISKAEFDLICLEIASGVYQLKIQTL
jgi:inhibitor of KinA